MRQLEVEPWQAASACQLRETQPASAGVAAGFVAIFPGP